MSSDGVDTGLINHAVQSMTSAAGGGSIDMASVLAKIQSLEREKLAMTATLETNSARSPPESCVSRGHQTKQNHFHHINTLCTGLLSYRRGKRLKWKFS
jgi:hypothetical protein